MATSLDLSSPEGLLEPSGMLGVGVCGASGILLPCGPSTALELVALFDERMVLSEADVVVLLRLSSVLIAMPIAL